MKRGISRDIFQTDIIKVIYSISDRNIVDDITEELIQKRGFERGLASDIMQGNAQYNILSTIELGVILDTIYKITSMPTARIDNYLELAEINQVRDFKFHKIGKKKKKNLLIFEDVRQVARDIWTVVVPAKRIVDLYRANKITYNPETQRDPKIIRSGDTIISTINVNASAVEAIRDDLIDGVFIPNTITFNVPMNDRSSIAYDKNKNRLVITGGIDILDGYHRSAGIVAASRELNDNLDINFELRITNFNVEKARRFIVQEDKRNSISKEYIKSIDTTDYISNVINDINESGRSEMRGLIVSDYDLVRAGRGVVTFDLMHSVIEKLWAPESMAEADDLAVYLTNFFNRLVSVFPRHFKTRKSTREEGFVISNSNMAFYLVLAKEVEGDDSWKTEYSSILKKLNVEKGINENIRKYNMTEIKKRTESFIGLCRETIKEAK